MHNQREVAMDSRHTIAVAITKNINLYAHEKADASNHNYFMNLITNKD